MKKPEPPKKKTGQTAADRDEAARLDRIAKFEANVFDDWLNIMSGASRLTIPQILEVLHFAGAEGFITNLSITDKGSSYNKDVRFRGWTPVEIACHLFIGEDAASPVQARNGNFFDHAKTAHRASILNITTDFLKYMRKFGGKS